MPRVGTTRNTLPDMQRLEPGERHPDAGDGRARVPELRDRLRQGGVMTTLDTARLREVAEATRLSPGGVERVEADAVNYAFFGAFDPPTVLALLDRLDAAEAALGKVLGLAEAATEQAYMQIATEKMLTVQPTALGGAKVPPHWRTEAEAEATIAVPTLLAALASTQREER